MMDYIDRFAYVEPSLHLWDEAYLIIMDNFSNVFLDSVCQDFIENLSLLFVILEKLNKKTNLMKII